MKITVPTKKLTRDILVNLEGRGLIRLLRPTERILKNPKTGCAESLYESDPAYGGHKLICVRKDDTDIRLTIHSDNEEVIFIEPGARSRKALYLVLGMCTASDFERKVRSRTLSGDDVAAFEVVFNDPLSCIFTVMKNVPHCEITRAEAGEPPVFYVTEPTKMDMHYVPVGDYTFTLDT